MTPIFGLDYFLCVFLSCSAVLQLAVHSGGFDMLKIIKHKRLNYSICVLTILTSTILFFVTDNRIVNDYKGGLNANQQALIFLSSAVTSFIFSALISQIINPRKTEYRLQNLAGIAAYRQLNLADIHKSKWIYIKNLTRKYLE